MVQDGTLEKLMNRWLFPKSGPVMGLDPSIKLMLSDLSVVPEPAPSQPFVFSVSSKVQKKKLTYQKTDKNSMSNRISSGFKRGWLENPPFKTR